MQRFHDMLFEAWREVSRHIEIQPATQKLTALLAPRIPLQQLSIYRLRPNENVLECVAPSGASISLSQNDRRELAAWSRSQSICHALPQLPVSAHSDYLIGPLIQHGEWIGLQVIQSIPGESFSPLHEQLSEALLAPVGAALENDRQLQELQTLRNAAVAEKTAALRRLGRDQLNPEIIGLNAGLRLVSQRVDMVAQTPVPVLILGETGTGKEAIVRLIHERSSRADGPFLRVNSGAIPSELIDTELFGHEKGSFTGAVSERRGWFERANGGTLLLDEIGELPLAAQVRLLRVLQEGTFERVGGDKSIQVNVRVVAATHRDLPTMVREGTFREDLWYRLSGFPILLPPLRDRRDDIPELAHHFALRAARHFSLMPQMPTHDDLQLLKRYEWPGNIRELASVIDRAAILGNGHKLEIATALGDPIQKSANGAPNTLKQENGGDTVEILSLDQAMRRHIESALKLANGRIEGPDGAATILQINPHTLRARMRKLGIDWAAFRFRR